MFSDVREASHLLHQLSHLILHLHYHLVFLLNDPQQLFVLPRFLQALFFEEGLVLVVAAFLVGLFGDFGCGQADKLIGYISRGQAVRLVDPLFVKLRSFILSIVHFIFRIFYLRRSKSTVAIKFFDLFFWFFMRKNFN